MCDPGGVAQFEDGKKRLCSRIPQLWAEVPWSLSGFQQQVALLRAGGSAAAKAAWHGAVLRLHSAEMGTRGALLFWCRGGVVGDDVLRDVMQQPLQLMAACLLITVVLFRY